MVKYIGSKRLLLPAILDAVGGIPGTRCVLDLFSGTSRVGHALKGAGYRVIANDHNAYARALAMCYVQADAEELAAPAAAVIAELNRIAAAATDQGDPFTDMYSRRARFFRPENGAKIFAVREAINAMALEPELEAVALTSLLEAADRVDSTTGVQMAYLKSWAPRSMRTLELRMPRLLPRARAGKGTAVCADAVAAAREWGGSADVAYLDPPYNQHSYLGNYHIWETLVRWDRPEVFGLACKRVDVRDRTSRFNSRRRCLEALREVLGALATPNLIVSFNDEGYIRREELQALLEARGPVRVVELAYRRYVGARIGIYNPRGEKVGRIGRLENTELLFIAGPPAAVRRASPGDAPSPVPPDQPPLRPHMETATAAMINPNAAKSLGLGLSPAT